VGRYVGALAFLGLALFTLYAITRYGGGAELTRMAPPPAGMGTVELIGRELFTQKVVVFQIAGVLLLIAVVGAMAVARGRQGAGMLMPTATGETAAEPKKLPAKEVRVLGLDAHAPARATAKVESGASS
jgi:NADH-quinone oxidoreductase subunit J